jgi:hypothetical protein
MLTDVAIRKINTPSKRREIRDEGAQGLYLIVQPTTGAPFDHSFPAALDDEDEDPEWRD